MGRDLKGRKCGKGISQRKDKKYTARFCAKNGKRREKHFDTLPEARNWLADAQYADRHNGLPTCSTITVGAWFQFWMENLIRDLAPNTIRNYRDRYVHNIKPVLGNMMLCDVKPMHCKAVFNSMEAHYAGSTIRQTYITIGTMFKAALINDMIIKHPLEGVKVNKPLRTPDDIHFLTIDEQTKFLEEYVLLLETGLRTAEMIGLTWDSIDWKRRRLTISKTLEYRHENGVWQAGPPKTKASYRTIPLTDRAYDVLETCYAEREIRKEAPLLEMVLPYMDRRSGVQKNLIMRDLVFVNWRTGEPAKNSSYDTHLYKLCDEAGIERFCMHALRHTYATRAIERGMQPKVLQKLLGHASIKTTMDRYVHVTDDSLVDAVAQFQTLGNQKAGIGAKLVRNSIENT